MEGIRVTHELPDVKILMVNYPIFLSSLRLSFPTFYNLISTFVLSSVFSEEDMKRYFFCLFFKLFGLKVFPRFFFLIFTKLCHHIHSPSLLLSPFLSDAFPKAMKREITNKQSFHVPFQSTPKRKTKPPFWKRKKGEKVPAFHGQNNSLLG